MRKGSVNIDIRRSFDNISGSRWVIAVTDNLTTNDSIIGLCCLIEHRVQVKLTVVPDYTIEIESQAGQDRLGNRLDLLFKELEEVLDMLNLKMER